MSRRGAVGSNPGRRPARPAASADPHLLSPSGAADAELRWFFNEAAIAVDQPSNFEAVVAGVTFVSLEEVERRAEAMHAARKIHDCLGRLRATDALLLAEFYTDRPWSRAVCSESGAAACAAALRAYELVRPRGPSVVPEEDR